MNPNKYKTFLIKWLKTEVKKANCKGVVFGVSGGIDSALVSFLAKEAFPNNHLALWINIENSNLSLKKAKLVFDQFNLKSKQINLTNSFLSFLKDTNVKFQTSTQKKLIEGNIKSRLRMTTLYEHAQLNNYLVLGTSNLSEITVGYFTKWGDSASDLFPIANLTKTKIYELGIAFGLPSEIIAAKPSADLYENQEDEIELGVKYSSIDNYIESKQISKKDKMIIEKLIKNSNHKRNTIINSPILKNFNKL